jgi:hypothetical protein
MNNNDITLDVNNINNGNNINNIIHVNTNEDFNHDDEIISNNVNVINNNDKDYNIEQNNINIENIESINNVTRYEPLLNDKIHDDINNDENKNNDNLIKKSIKKNLFTTEISGKPQTFEEQLKNIDDKEAFAELEETLFEGPIINYINDKNIKIKNDALIKVKYLIDNKSLEENILDYMAFDKLPQLLKDNNIKTIKNCSDLIMSIIANMREKVTKDFIYDCIINIIEKGIACNNNSVKTNSLSLLIELIDIVIVDFKSITDIIELISIKFNKATKPVIQIAYVTSIYKLLIEFGNKEFPVKKFIKYSFYI